jgi:hypothetical protein
MVKVIFNDCMTRPTTNDSDYWKHVRKVGGKDLLMGKQDQGPCDWNAHREYCQRDAGPSFDGFLAKEILQKELAYKSDEFLHIHIHTIFPS